MLKITIFAAVAAITIAASSVYAQSAAVTAARTDCPTYAGNSDQCINNYRCRTLGVGTGHCQFSCTTSDTRATCVNETSCMPKKQAAGSSSSACTFNCSTLPNWQACFKSYRCLWLDGTCQARCSDMQDDTACNNSVDLASNGGKRKTLCHKWDNSLSSTNCRAKCELAPSSYLCNQMSQCQWNEIKGECHPSCNEYSNDFRMCMSRSKHCHWYKGKCSQYDTASIGNVDDCIVAGGMWYKGKCETRCYNIAIPSTNWTARQACLEQPLCGGTTSCDVYNCSLLSKTSYKECQLGTGSSCKWVAKSDTDPKGVCTLSCNNQFYKKGTCTEKFETGQQYCTAVKNAAGTITTCTDGSCSKFLDAELCTRAAQSCKWTGTECVGVSCSLKSTTMISGAPSACQNTSYCSQIERYNQAGTKFTSCIQLCKDMKSARACQTASGCVWADGACKIKCSYTKDNITECNKQSHCEYFNNSMTGSPSCEPKCESLEKDVCNHVGGCVYYGGEDCGCKLECEKQPDNRCPSPCYRNSLFGGYCTSPRHYGTECDDGLSAGVIAAIVVGVVVVVAVVVVAAVLCSGGGSAAAGTAAVGTAPVS